MLMNSRYIVIKRTHVERGLIRYEPFGYGSSISEACAVAEEYPSTADVGDILIVCDLAHVSMPEKKALYLYVARGHGSIEQTKNVPSSLLEDSQASNWFDIWGGDDSYPEIMYNYARRRFPREATNALIECGDAYNFNGPRTQGSEYCISDLMNDLVWIGRANRSDLRRVFSQIIAEVIPLHEILLR